MMTVLTNEFIEGILENLPSLFIGLITAINGFNGFKTFSSYCSGWTQSLVAIMNDSAR
jgi:hypothetical protein